MEYLIWIPTIVLFITGLVGTIIPFMPGIVLIAAGILWQGIMGTSHLAWWHWATFVLLLAVGLVIDKVTGGVGAKVFGSARAGIIGALLGVFIGPVVMSPIIGLFVGPFLGALAGELIFSRKKLAAASKAGAGATLGMLAGIALEFLVGILMICWFLFCYFVLGTDPH